MRFLAPAARIMPSGESEVCATHARLQIAALELFTG
jgi:hypothetical protein